jgi:putative Holliday junction resolvase
VKRVLGLDLGERRIGYALGHLGDFEEPLVLPGGTLEIQSEEDALKRLQKLIEAEEPDTVVIGLPLLRDGETSQSRKVRHLGELLKEAFPKLDWLYWDERLSSVEASQKLVAAELKHSGKSKRGRVDAVAASLILRGFLDAPGRQG